MRRIVFVLVLLGASAGIVPAAQGNAIGVNTTIDQNTPDKKCTLREAIQSANTNTAVGGCAGGNGPDKIVLAEKKTYTLTINGNDDSNAAGDLDISSDVTIVGKKTTITQTTLSGDRIIDVLSGFTTLKGLIITGGQARMGASGGGIRNAGTGLFLKKVTVTGNAAGDGAPGFTNGEAGGMGGGVYSSGGVQIEKSTISSNQAGDGGPGGTSSFGGSGGHGGGLALVGDTLPVLISASTITGNVAGAGGMGGIAAATPAGQGGSGGAGGGIFTNGMSAPGFEVTESAISDNLSGNGGAGGSGSPLGDHGGGDGGDGGNGGNVFTSTPAAQFVRTTISGGFAGNAGSGGNGANALGMTPGGNGGDGGNGGEGGGIYAGHLTSVYASTVSNNQSGGPALGGSGGTGTPPGSAGTGGDFGFGGGIRSGAILHLTNVTVSANGTSAEGGGIWSSASADLNNVTVANNTATTGGGIYTLSTFVLRNSLVADNVATTGPDCSGTIQSNGFNLMESVSGCTGAGFGNDITGIDPALKPLDRNGGPTMTHAIAKSSPAFGSGSPDPFASGPNACEARDQRNVKRTVVCDIGAFEFVKR